MTRPLGKQQLECLMALSSPSLMLVVGSAVSKSLVKRGMLKPNFADRPEAWHRITPCGLRALADSYEAGQLDQFMKPLIKAPPPLPQQQNTTQEKT